MRPGTFLLLLASLLAAARGLVVGPAPVRPRALSPRSISPAACAAEEVTASDLAISFSDAAMTQLREEGWAVPQDYRGPDGGPLTVHDNSVEPISDWAW